MELPDLDNYLPVARQKLTSLIDETDFSLVESVSDDSAGPVVLVFHGGKKCSVDRWGRVIWLHLDEPSGVSG
ncbi:hypothetical protein CAG67_15890 [Vibrio sp. V41_P2S12T139]|uniref:hypothetical protein n=1 Tax=Vibrio sp. V42_P2S4T144 TaxID=1938693 RepID=UPI001372F595|nr:hypothetical protein [Vibrio sp. V41_P2S12T139]NAW93397.1 hypothetical protein [Vibrio sp. V42_P2S4T144]